MTFPSSPFRFSLRHLFELLTWAAVGAWLYSFHDAFAASARLLLFCYGYLAFRAGFLSRVFGSLAASRSAESSADDRLIGTRWYAVAAACILGGPAAGVFGWLGFGFLMGQGVPGPGFLAYPVLASFFVGGAAAGATTGALCSLFCGARLGRQFAWLFVTTLGWLVGLFLLIAFLSLHSRTPAYFYVALSTLGLLAGGLLQRWVDGFDDHAARWAGRGTCCGLLLTAILEISGASPAESYWLLPMAWALGTLGGVTGSVFGGRWAVTRVMLSKTVAAATGCMIVVLSSAVLIRETASHRTGFSETARVKAPGLVSCLAVSPDGTKLIAGSRMDTSANTSDSYWRGNLSVWNTTTWTPVVQISQPRWVNSVVISPDGKTLAVAFGTFFDGTSRERDILRYEPTPGGVKLFDLETMKEKAVILHKQGVFALCYSPDGTLLAGSVLGADNPLGMVLLWETKTLTEQRRVLNVGGACGGVELSTDRRMTFSPDGSLLAVAEVTGLDRTGRVRIVGLATGEESVIELRNTVVLSLTFNDDGTKLAVGGADRAVLVDMKTLVRQRGPSDFFINEYGGRVNALAFTSDGEILAIAGHWIGGVSMSRGGAGLFNIQSGKPQASLRLEDRNSMVHSLTFSADDRILYTGLANGEIIAWEVQ